jgi:hypothetical protein
MLTHLVAICQVLIDSFGSAAAHRDRQQSAVDSTGRCNTTKFCISRRSVADALDPLMPPAKCTATALANDIFEFLVLPFSFYEIRHQTHNKQSEHRVYHFL